MRTPAARGNGRGGRSAPGYFMQIEAPVVTLQSPRFGEEGATGFEQAETTRVAAARTMAAKMLRRMGLPRGGDRARERLPAR